MRFMIEEDVMVVWLEDKDWLQLIVNAGIDLAPDERFAAMYLSNQLLVQETLVHLAECFCPAEDQDAVRRAAKLLEDTGAFASILLLSERYAGETLPERFRALSVTTNR